MNRLTARNTQARGFTLVELLVVVAIIALLLSILLPALNRARGLAQAVACMSNVRQIGVAMEYYKNDTNGHIIRSQSNVINDPMGSWWYSQIGIRYLQLEKSASFFESSNFKLFQCPADRSIDYNQLSYGYNFFIPADATVDDVIPMRQAILMDNPAGIGGNTRIGYSQVPALDTIQDRHNGQSNVLFVDSHVSREQLDELIRQLYPIPIKEGNNNIKFWRQLQ